MLRTGSILLLVGLAILSPLDDVFIYLFLVPVFGVGVIPFMVGLGLVLSLVGATLLGVHILPLLQNPVILGMFLLSLGIIVYLAFEYDFVMLAFGG